jgi:NAD+ diphosphatase
MREDQQHCPRCGHRLIEKELTDEGIIPYCETCKDYRFPFFSVAVSMVVLSPDEKEILLIKQYGRDRNILVAGYINITENAEECLKRELMEETGLEASDYRFNKSLYYGKSNTLILNFIVKAKSKELHCNHEIDSYQWYSLTDAKKNVVRPSLACQFIDKYLSERGIE